MKDYMNDPKYSEFQNIITEAYKEAHKLNASDCTFKTIQFIQQLAKKLNDDECNKFHKRMKKWYNKVGI